HFLPVVIYTPTAGTTYDKFIEYHDLSWASVMRESSRMQREYIAKTCAELGLAFVDLTAEFQAAAANLEDKDMLFLVYDLHLSPMGHRVTADVLAKQLPGLLTRQNAATP